MPCESAEANDDWDIFEPKPKISSSLSSKKRKRHSQNEISHNGVNENDYATRQNEDVHATLNALAPDPVSGEGLRSMKKAKVEEDGDATTEHPAEEQGDTAASDPPTTNGVHAEEDPRSSNAEPTDQPVDEKGEDEAKEKPPEKMDLDAEGQDGDTASEDEAQPLPTRRITRALAAEHNSSSTATPPLSPNSTTSSIDSSLLQPDPLFLLPPALAASHRTPRNLSRLGIPVEEYIETRRLLTLFIQKQEESVRGYEAVGYQIRDDE